MKKYKRGFIGITGVVFIAFAMSLISISEALIAQDKLKEETVDGTPENSQNNWGYNQDLCKHYTSYRASGPINIDGTPDENTWKTAEKSPRFVDLVTGLPGTFDTRAAILWDEEYLYIAFWVQEPDVLASLTKRESPIWYDNDVEIFIAGQDCYYEFEINALGTILDIFYIWQDAYKKGSRFDIQEFDLLNPLVWIQGGDPFERVHPRGGRWAFTDWNFKGMKSAVKINGTLNKRDDVDDGWTVEVAFPWSGMKILAGDKNLPPGEGDTWRMDISRFQHFKQEGVGPDVKTFPGWAWNSHGAFNSHIPEVFTFIHFSEKIVGKK